MVVHVCATDSETRWAETCYSSATFGVSRRGPVSAKSSLRVAFVHLLGRLLWSEIAHGDGDRGVA